MAVRDAVAQIEKGLLEEVTFGQRPRRREQESPAALLKEIQAEETLCAEVWGGACPRRVPENREWRGGKAVGVKREQQQLEPNLGRTECESIRAGERVAGGCMDPFWHQPDSEGTERPREQVAWGLDLKSCSLALE